MSRSYQFPFYLIGLKLKASIGKFAAKDKEFRPVQGHSDPSQMQKRYRVELAVGHKIRAYHNSRTQDQPFNIVSAVKTDGKNNQLLHFEGCTLNII